MKNCKKVMVFTLAACLIFALFACTRQDFEKVRSIEYHFLQEEYEESYNEISKTIKLEPDANHKININASCTSGTIMITIRYTDTHNELHAFHITAPCTETIDIPVGTTTSVEITAKIDPKTQGDLIIDILTDR